MEIQNVSSKYYVNYAKNNESKVSDGNTASANLLTPAEEEREGKVPSSEKNAENSRFDILERLTEDGEENENTSIQDYSKGMKIARRIMNGDKVPAKDVKFLAEKFPELYKNALIFRRDNPEPKKYKSVLNKKDDENALKPNEYAASVNRGETAVDLSDASEIETDG